MTLMAALLLLAFAAVFSIIYQAVAPAIASKVNANTTLAAYTNSYFGRTAVTTVTVFLVLIVVSFAMSFIDAKPKLPGA